MANLILNAPSVFFLLNDMFTIILGFHAYYFEYSVY